MSNWRNYVTVTPLLPIPGPTQIAVSALPSFEDQIRDRRCLPFPNQTGGGGDFENFDPPQIRPVDE